MPEAAWKPNPGRQTDFLKSATYELLYGGAAGGGKSEGLLMGALRYIERPEYQALYLRRTYPELETSVIPRSKLWYPRLGGRYNESKHFWRFPSGALIWFGHLEHEESVDAYQSSEFQYLAFDELTSFTRRQYEYMLARARSSAGIPLRIRSGSNPGGEGHDWVQRRWAPWLGLPPGEEWTGIKGKPGEHLWYLNEDQGERWLQLQEAQAMLKAWHAAPPSERIKLPLPLTRVFIPARIEDNPKLSENDPGYAQRLMGLDPVRRAQLRAGDWNIRPAAGLYFRREWFTFVDKGPTEARRVRHWDLAGTEPESGSDPDWTVGCRLAQDEDGKLTVEHVERGRWPPAGVEERILTTAKDDGEGVEISLPQDPGQAGKFQAGYLVKKLQGYTVRAAPETGDKVTRAGPISSQASPPAKNVSIVRGPWNEAFLLALERFPEGKKDDVDALSGAYRHLVDSGAPPSFGSEPIVTRWGRRR